MPRGTSTPPQDPTHAAALSPLHRLSILVPELKKAVALRPLAESERQRFLNFAIEGLKAMKFTSLEIVEALAASGFTSSDMNGAVHAAFPQPEPPPVKSLPASSVTNIPAPVPTIVKIDTPPLPERSGFLDAFRR